MTCPERQQLLTRFSSAFEDFSASVRELKAAGQSANPADESVQHRSAQAQRACEQLWAQLQEHHSKHRCWP
jgi:hypothetical protein